MTYKEKKMSIFNEVFAPSFKDFDFLMSVNQFIEETIDELLGCLPDEKDKLFIEQRNMFHIGYNVCREDFLQNLEEKAGEV